jgi:uncharacterized protein (TIGR02996 family)
MSTSDQLAFWAAIRAAPTDDTPRLIYADWLDEHGDPDRAEFIRVQCALARFGPDRRRGGKKRPLLEARERALLDENRSRWLAEFRNVLKGATPYADDDRWLNNLPFRRGFVGPLRVDLKSADRLTSADDRLEPIDSLIVSDCRRDYRHRSVARITRWSGAGCVTQLSIPGGRDSDVNVIVASHGLRHLTHLTLCWGGLTDVAVAKLANWPGVAGIQSFALFGNRITDAGADALVDSPYIGRPHRLALGGNAIGPRGQRRLRRRFGEAADVTNQTKPEQPVG